MRVTYDPAKVRYDQLLRIFFSVITDPTQLNRQGPDTGLHYRSALVPINEEQRLTAAAYLASFPPRASGELPIVTRIESHLRFYPAENTIRTSWRRTRSHPYILAWDMGKVEALKRQFPEHYKPASRRAKPRPIAAP